MSDEQGFASSRGLLFGTSKRVLEIDTKLIALHLSFAPHVPDMCTKHFKLEEILGTRTPTKVRMQA